MEVELPEYDLRLATARDPPAVVEAELRPRLLVQSRAVKHSIDATGDSREERLVASPIRESQIVAPRMQIRSRAGAEQK